MDRKKLQSFIACRFERAVRHITDVDLRCTSIEHDGFPVRRFCGGTVYNVVSFFARMSVKHTGRAGLVAGSKR